MMKNSYLSIIAIITIVAFIGMLTIYYPKATVTGLAINATIVIIAIIER